MFHCLSIRDGYIITINFDDGELKRRNIRSGNNKRLAESKGFNTDVTANRLRFYAETCSILNVKYDKELLTKFFEYFSGTINIWEFCHNLAKKLTAKDNPFAAERFVELTYNVVKALSDNIIGWTHKGLVYVDREGIVRLKVYNYRVTQEIVESVKTIPDVLSDFCNKHNLNSKSMYSLYYDSKVFEYIGLTVSELTQGYFIGSVDDNLEDLISRINKPKIQSTTEDIIVRCEVSILQRGRTWELTRKLIGTYKKSIVNLVLSTIESNDKFLCLGIPINFFSLDNIQFTRDFSLLFTFGLKKEITEQLND